MSKLSLEQLKALPERDQEELFKKLDRARKMYKAVNYSCVYGAGGPKVAITAGVEERKGYELVEAYWKRNWSVKSVAEQQVVKTCNGQKWLFNPVSKLWYSLRAEKDRFSTLNQGTGVYCFDTWVKHIRNRRPQLSAQFHDEVVLCVKRGHRDQCTALLKASLKAANEELNLNRELDCSVAYGDTYAQIH